jgi:Tol biopolymer transport system component
MLVALVLAGSLGLVPAAHAIYGPAAGGFGAELVSVDNASDEQGNAPTTDADISADGRYVVFQTRATNFFEDDGGVAGPHGVEPDAEPSGTLREGGIFRYDRVTGAIQLVADGTEVHTEGPEKGKLIFRGAQNPSVSADGRYVAFSTAQRLVPQDTNENVDVYVRDMDVPLTASRQNSGAYTLVSARDGGEEPATYGVSGQGLPGDRPGADIWPSTAISADGKDVVFRTTEVTSDLPDGAPGIQPEQLFVRDLEAKTTTLLSREATSGEPAGGVGGPASISGDGSTVAWVGTNAPAQTRFIPGESLSASQPYYLWRRWREGGPTRRITGIADPDDPACHEGEGVSQDPLSSGPCYGPLSEQESSLASIAETAPTLSSDGYTVAFLAGSALRPNITKSAGLDVFVTSMAPGMTRKNSTRELTLGVKSGNPGSTPSLETIALSADGSTIAFTSLRDSFVLPEPKPIGSFRPIPSVSDLYVIHLGEDTLERAVVSYEDGEPNGPITDTPTLSADGSIVAFTSSAPNLIFGDANNAADAFAADLRLPGGTALPEGINTVQAGFSLTTVVSPELGLHIKRGRGDRLLLLVETPAAGRLTAQAQGTITIKVGKRTHKRKVTLAHTSGTARSEGTTTLTLQLAPRYARDLRVAGKLKALVTVAFVPAAAGEGLSSEATATFVAATGRKATTRRLGKTKRSRQ